MMAESHYLCIASYFISANVAVAKELIFLQKHCCWLIFCLYKIFIITFKTEL